MADLQFNQTAPVPVAQPNYGANAANFYGPLLSNVPPSISGQGDIGTQILNALGLGQLSQVVSMPGLNAAANAANQGGFIGNALAPFNPINTVSRAIGAVKAYNNPPTTAAPTAPTTPPSFGAGGPMPQLPQVPTKVGAGGLIGGGGPGTSLDLGTMPPMPNAPQVSIPEAQTVPGYDFTEYKKLLDKIGVSSGENVANVFGGLAKGAGSVDATKPGSFAAALAAAGAGGMEGFRATAQADRDVAMKKAAAELTMLQLQHGASKDNAELAQKAAELRLNAEHVNANFNFLRDQEMYKNGIPQIQHDANGLTVRSIDPNTGKITAQYYNTKTFSEQLEKLKELAGILGPQGAEGIKIQLLAKQYQGQPDVLRGELTKEAMRSVLDSNAGAAVFGQSYELAAKMAAKALQAQNPTLMATKPEVYKQELDKSIGAILMNDYKFNSYGWLKDAAKHSLAARYLYDMMSQAQQQPAGPQGPPTAPGPASPVAPTAPGPASNAPMPSATP